MSYDDYLEEDQRAGELEEEIRDLKNKLAVAQSLLDTSKWIRNLLEREKYGQ